MPVLTSCLVISIIICWLLLLAHHCYLDWKLLIPLRFLTWQFYYFSLFILPIRVRSDQLLVCFLPQAHWQVYLLHLKATVFCCRKYSAFCIWILRRSRCGFNSCQNNLVYVVSIRKMSFVKCTYLNVIQVFFSSQEDWSSLYTFSFAVYNYVRRDKRRSNVVRVFWRFFIVPWFGSSCIVVN